MSRISSLFSQSPFERAILAMRSSLLPVPRPAPRAGLPNLLPPPRFSRRLREETDRAHRLMESTSFVRGVLKGSVDLQSFANMQAGLYLIYSAMEEEIVRNRRHPLIGMIDFPELQRTQALQRDLVTFFGDNWREQLTLTPARRTYVDRIRWVGENEPELLVAHSYTRYLGDLSGGRVVESIARRALKLEQSKGLQFFQFPQIPNRKTFKEEYRRRLDEMPLGPPLSDALVAEANRVFGLNRAIFEELEGSWLRAIRNLLPRPLSDIRNGAK